MAIEQFPTSNIICFTDIDGSYINTNKPKRREQAKALAKISKLSVEEAYQKINDKGFTSAVEEYTTIDEFFQGPYKTFDVEEGIKTGEIYIFTDAVEFTKSGIPTIAISNSDEAVTRKKLQALDIKDIFAGIYAEYLQGKAKPNIYMAEKAIRDLDKQGLYNPKQLLIHVGDEAYDVEFGNNIKTIHSNTLNLLIDREQKYQNAAKADSIIRLYSDIYNFLR